MNCFILIPRDTARERGIKFYFTGIQCPRGNIWLRRTSTANCVCVDCLAVKNKGNSAHYHRIKDDPEFKEKIRAYTIKNREWKRAYDKEYMERNRDHKNKLSREWAKNNRDKRRAICHNYDARRRAVEKTGVGVNELMKWKRAQRKVCYWCGVKCRSDFHVDHYIPLSKGGRHELDNLVIACAPCNLRKNAKDPYEFAQERGRLF